MKKNIKFILKFILIYRAVFFVSRYGQTAQVYAIVTR